ncbi:glycoside hydrolase superfamily [Naematelia encephala]|uniref:Glycoside hydrolase superfamily n=1 Tax=Naematelia encephala TaxID=71784 RepID=A0A1Y2BDG4_9TREE|nr:glycoside hydrolase superfamily [Naematelia encephala]
MWTNALRVLILAPSVFGVLLPRQNGTSAESIQSTISSTVQSISSFSQGASTANSTSASASKSFKSTASHTRISPSSSAWTAIRTKTSSSSYSSVISKTSLAVPGTEATSINSGTDDLGWIYSGVPTQTTLLLSTNPDAVEPTRTSPVGTRGTPAVTFSEYSSSELASLWSDWVGEVQQPPFDTVPEPPKPYPLPNAPPPLFPEYLLTNPKNILCNYSFPDGFLFGWATAAQQWEGAVMADGKGPSIWDWASRFPGFIADNTTSDVGDLGYYLYKEDLARLAALGGNVYSFSMFWTRIYPFAVKGSPVNQAGLDFYSDLIDYCWCLGIEPVVTLFHWDTPLTVQLLYGGFASEDIIDDYVNYAETVFKAFNGKVKKWVTFNEPVVFCSQMGYPVNTTLPLNLNSTVYPYTCSYHLTLAHATAVKRFRELGIEGEIAFKSDNFVGIPWRDGNQDDIEAVERHQAYQIGIFAEPIYNTGDWPDLIKHDLPPEILPRFNQSQKDLIKGSADFFAIDGYRDGYVQVVDGGVEACVANISNPLWPVCNQVNFFDSTPAAWGIGNFGNWPTTPWLQNTWQFVRPFLADLVNRYPTKGGIYLSEFGFSEPFENEKNYIYQITEDTGRTTYYLSYLGEVLKAINDDGLPVKGTFAWSLVDNFEWNSGLSTRFGCQFVDYNSPTLERYFKRSAMEMSEFWNTHRCSANKTGE